MSLKNSVRAPQWGKVPPVFRLAKRAVEAAVLLFAAYAFATIPLGKRTAFQHTLAILSTEEAAEAGRELKQAGGRMVDELLHPNLVGKPELPKLSPPQSRVAWRLHPDAGLSSSHGETAEHGTCTDSASR